MRFFDLEGIYKIPHDRVVTYVILVVDYQAQTKRPQSSKDNRWVESSQRYVPWRTNNTYV